LSVAVRRPLIATYRLQLGPELSFARAVELVPYLAKLGVSHLYLSPVLDAAAGSLHGYDVVNHTKLSQALGGEEGFGQLVSAAHAAAIGIVLDLVPNHMSIADAGNQWWWDVLENGRSGRWAHAFDVDWDPPEQRLKDVILLPVLGEHLSQILAAKQVKVAREGAVFTVRYYEHQYPVAPRSLGMLLRHATSRCDEPQLGFLADAFAELPPPTSTEAEKVERRHRDKEVLRSLLDTLMQNVPAVAQAIDETMALVNDTPALLDALLEGQNYRLAYWRAAEHDLDYRRFFDVNSLVGLRMEDPRVFAAAHALIEKLYLRGDLDGLRVDHVDGLADPAGYLAQLRALVPDATIHVEKILGKDEALPAWPVEGTTGYEHGAELAALYTDPSSEAPLRALEAELTGDSPAFHTLATAARQQVMTELLASDVNRAAHALMRLGERHWQVRDYSRPELRDVVATLAACFPVYRTYVVPAEKTVSPADAEVISRAIDAAKKVNERIAAPLFEFVADLLLLRRTGSLEAEFVSRFQQLTAPAMAKGVEDTAFYRYTTLLALAEVGGSPERFHLTLDEFHARNASTQARWPYRLNASSTHDSKRSADVRARLIAMSQQPDAFAAMARKFFALTQTLLTDGLPDPKLRMTALQLLVGAWPLSEERLRAALEKSAREAKTKTSWLRPNEKYDAALTSFSKAVMADDAVRGLIDGFVTELMPQARAISLGWVLLKCAGPGVPDFYQGTELWNFSLVDPDNRAPVDWRVRTQAIDETAIPPLEKDELGLTKMFVTQQALWLRRESPALFDATAKYEALEVTGPQAAAVVAFARVAADGSRAVAVVPRWPGKNWEGTSVQLPEGTYDSHLDARRGLKQAVPLTTLFAKLPLALLSSRS